MVRLFCFYNAIESPYFNIGIHNMRTFGSFTDLARANATRDDVLLNTPPSGAEPALTRDLSPSEKGYIFEAIRQSDGTYAIAGCAVEDDGERGEAFWVSDVPDDARTDPVKASRVVDALNGRYRSKAVREERLKNEQDTN